MKFIILKFFFIILAVSVISKASPLTPRPLKYAKDATEKQFPFMVIIINQRDHPECSGTLITDKHVLTAAKCILYNTKSRHQLIKCIAGELNSHVLFYNKKTSPTTQVREISSKIVHPKAVEYHKETSNTEYSIAHDLAVITVKESFNPSEHVSPIEISRIDYTKTKLHVLGMGYGLLKPEERIKQQQLVYGNLTIQVDHPFKALHPTTYFTRDETGECPGDIGGPLYFNNTVIGVGFNLTDGYCTYTNVFVELDWILEKSGQPRPTESENRNEPEYGEEPENGTENGNEPNNSNSTDKKRPGVLGALCKLNGQRVKIGKVLLSGVQMLHLLHLFLT